MLISETVIWDMLTNAFTPASRATAAMVTVASRYPGGYGHAEVDPAAAADDAINITRFEEVADHHFGAGGSQERRPFVLAPHHGANRKPSIEEQAGDSASDRPQLAGCPGYQYRSVIYHAPYLLAPGNSLIISKLQHSEAELERLLTPENRQHQRPPAAGTPFVAPAPVT